MREMNIKSAFDDVYDMLDDLLLWNLANPNYVRSKNVEEVIGKANQVLSFWNKLRKEP